MKKITFHELKDKLDKDAIILTDVREPIEHALETIEGAHLIPLSQVSKESLSLRKSSVVIH